MVVVASIGNSGADGIYSAGAPGVGDKVIGVASYDNTHIQQIVFKVSPDGLGIAVRRRSGLAAGPDLRDDDAGEDRHDDDERRRRARTRRAGTHDWQGRADPARQRSGRLTCTFYLKAINAQNAGAAAVVLYNNVAGRPQPDRGRLAAGDDPGRGHHRRRRRHPRRPDRSGSDDADMGHRTGHVPERDGQPDLELQLVRDGRHLELKPDIGAPGGLIRSTYPLEASGYATISGTSMASPHVAGAAALLIQARPNLAAADFRTVLQNSADPKPWSGSPGLGFLDIVHRQGAGMLDIDDAIASTTTISPGKLSLGEGMGGSRTLTLSNRGSAPVTYDLSRRRCDLDRRRRPSGRS